MLNSTISRNQVCPPAFPKTPPPLPLGPPPLPEMAMDQVRLDCGNPLGQPKVQLHFPKAPSPSEAKKGALGAAVAEAVFTAIPGVAQIKAAASLARSENTSSLGKFFFFGVGLAATCGASIAAVAIAASIGGAALPALAGASVVALGLHGRKVYQQILTERPQELAGQNRLLQEEGRRLEPLTQGDSVFHGFQAKLGEAPPNAHWQPFEKTRIDIENSRGEWLLADSRPDISTMVDVDRIRFRDTQGNRQSINTNGEHQFTAHWQSPVTVASADNCYVTGTFEHEITGTLPRELKENQIVEVEHRSWKEHGFYHQPVKEKAVWKEGRLVMQDHTWEPLVAPSFFAGSR